jgi:RNA polymerase sigma-70 factor (ECF subfamily)
MVDDTNDRDDGGASSSLREAVRVRFALGRAAWPQLAIQFDTFQRYFARHTAAEAPPAEAHAADMYFACACAHGIDEALAIFERTLAKDMERAVASIDSSRAFVEETLQVTRERLFVHKNGHPGKIADYAGRASLRTWLCAVAVRSAISLRRGKAERAHKPFAVNDDRRLIERGPELEYLRRRYKDAFEDAVRAALARLPSKQRMLLRLNVLDRMSVDKLATAYGVGRSTAARWLANARRTLLEQTRRELCAKLRLTSSEFDSLGQDIRSQLEVSARSLLADSARHSQ